MYTEEPGMTNHNLFTAKDNHVWLYTALPTCVFGACAELGTAMALTSGFGGLEVANWPLVPQVRGFKPGRSRRIFRAKKSSVRLPSVPCRKITACERTRKWRGSRHFRKNSRPFLTHCPTFRYWGSLASFQTLAVPCGEGWNVLITGPPSWRFDVLLTTGLCKNFPAEKAQK